MASSTVYLDNWNYYTLNVSRTTDVKNNKSYFTATGNLHVVHNGHVRSDYGTTVWAHTGNKKWDVYDLGEGDYSYTNNFEISHDANGYLAEQTIGGGCWGGWGSVNTSVKIEESRLDRNGITISNYTLRDCVSKKLYINFSFNYDPSNTWYRYRKSTNSNWETDWIEWNTYGGSYNASAKTGYFITPKLQANTSYVIEIKVTRGYNDVSTTKSGTFYVESSVFFKNGNNWVDGEVYIKKNGVWKKGIPYIKKNGVWKEAS